MRAFQAERERAAPREFHWQPGSLDGIVLDVPEESRARRFEGLPSRFEPEATAGATGGTDSGGR